MFKNILKLILPGLFIVAIASAKVNSDDLKAGLRSDGSYKVWVYFKDKPADIKLNGVQKAVARRLSTGTDIQRINYLTKPVSEVYISQIRNSGAIVRHSSKWLNAVSISADLNQINKIATFGFVRSVEPVKAFRKIERFEDFALGKSSFDSTFYGIAWDQLSQIKIDKLHDSGYRGAGVRILVLDTGFDMGHQVFDQINLIDEYDFINFDDVTANETAFESSQAQDRHGTVILSALASNLPGQMIGSAYEAEYLLAKTEDVSAEYPGEEDNFVAGLEWGEENGADVMSASLGYIDWYDFNDLDGKTAVTTKAVNIAVDSLGMICVVAAGNEGKSGIIAPADAFNVISVGAVYKSGNIAGFSSRGPSFDGRIKPEVVARGVATATAIPGTIDGYSSYSGTSLAAPLVAGGMALLRQAYPEVSNIELRKLLLESSSQYNSPDSIYGYGLPDFFKAVTNTEIEIEKDKIQIYPNPYLVKSVDKNISINYESSSRSDGEITVYNLLGQKVIQFSTTHSIGLNTVLINPKKLSSSVYFVEITGSTNLWGKKHTLTGKFSLIK